MINDFIEIAKLIAKFQVIETSIKVFLIKKEIEEDETSDNLKKQYSLISVDDLPYGILLKKYKKKSNHQELYERLLELKDFRNFLVHKSFLSTSTSFPKEMKEFVGVHLIEPIDYFSINKELDDCILLFCKKHTSSQES